MTDPPPPPLVLHLPHASMVVPGRVRPQLVLSDEDLERELALVTDHFTDELFALPAEEAVTIRYPVSRLVVDPERLADDDHEPMAARGMGAVYTHTSHLGVLRAAPTRAERKALLDAFYYPHHAKLEAAVEAALAAHGRCLILDAHSFPPRPLPYELDQDPARPDFCFGTDAFHTPAALRVAAEETCANLGYAFEENRPFAGTLTPLRYHETDAGVASIMVEVNRGLYLEDSLAARKSDDFAVTARAVQRIVAAIRAAWAAP